MKHLLLAVSALAAACLAAPSSAAITSIVETGLAADRPAIAEAALSEGSPALSDRVHTHRGPAFDAAGILNVNGVTQIPLPTYLLGNPYVRFANDARENAGYSAVVTSDRPAIFYLLIDNRLNGPGAAGKANSSDPILGGVLQWVIDGGWQRVNTGISPNGQGDFTSIDEAADGTRNNFYSIYKLPAAATAVTVRNNGMTGQNNICLVAGPVPITGEPITAFAASPLVISPGDSTTLSWLINPGATSASISSGVGNILPLTTNGGGSLAVSPSADTTYTLTVSAGASATRDASVQVRPLGFFRAEPSYLPTAASPVTLSWRVRPDAITSATISGIGPVAPYTNPDGTGTLTVSPATTTTWSLSATASGRSESASATTVVRPAGTRFALLDLGATDSRPEPEALTGMVIGAGPNNTNATPLFTTPLTSETGAEFTLAIDSNDHDGIPVGGLDWRDRGDAPDRGLTLLSEDFVKNNAGLVHVTLGSLPAGTYGITAYLLDPTLSQCDRIKVLVTDANRTFADAGTQGDASYPGHPTDTGAPGLVNVTSGAVDRKAVRFTVASNGINDVQFWFDGRGVLPDSEVPLAGLWIVKDPPDQPIVSFVNRTPLLAPGSSASLSWIIASNASAASINNGIGNVLPLSVNGIGSTSVSPLTDTTYTLAVTSAAGSGTATVTVPVRPIGSFSASPALITAGSPVTLTWRVRPDATASIVGIGSVAAFTAPDGSGSLTVNPSISSTFTLTASAAGRNDSATTTVLVQPAGTRFGIIDLGATDGRPEPDALTNAVIGAGPNNTNAFPLDAVPLVSDTGVPFSISIDSLDPSGNPVGALDWRDRGDAPASTLALLAEDHLKNNAGLIHVTLSGLPAGTFNLTSFLIDAVNSQCAAIRVLVTDADRNAADSGLTGNASYPGHPANTGAPGLAGLTPVIVESKSVQLTVRSDGSTPIQLWFDGSADPTDKEVPLAGLWIYQLSGPAAVQILSLSPNPAAGTVTLTFASSPGATYAIDASASLTSWTRIAPSVPAAAGPSTSFTESNLPPGTTRRFYRVIRN
jgi:hypothetical protein